MQLHGTRPQYSTTTAFVHIIDPNLPSFIPAMQVAVFE